MTAHPDAATGMGMDAAGWARDGLVDLVVASPSDFDISIDLWHRRLGKARKRVPVLPALEHNARPWPDAGPGGPMICSSCEVSRLLRFIEVPALSIYSTGWTVKRVPWPRKIRETFCAQAFRQ